MDPFISVSGSSVRRMIAARLEELFTTRPSRHDPDFTVRFLATNFSIPESIVESVLSGGKNLDPGKIREIQRAIDSRLSSEQGQEAAAMFGWNGFSRCLSASFFGPADTWDPELRRILGEYARAKKTPKVSSETAEHASASNGSRDEGPVGYPAPAQKRLAREKRARPEPKPEKARSPKLKAEKGIVTGSAEAARPADSAPPAAEAPQLPEPRAVEPVGASVAVTDLDRRFPTRTAREQALERWHRTDGNAAIRFDIETTGFLLARATTSDPQEVINWLKACGRLDDSTSRRLLAALNR